MNLHASLCALVFALVALVLPSRAEAIDRNCPRGQTWSISQGTCVKKKPAPKLSAQEKYDRASDDLEGKGKAPDPKRGLRLLEENCAADHGSSCTLLGFLYARGRSTVTRDDPKALQYFQQACKLDDLEGCFNIGDLAYRTGDNAGARSAFTRACELGSGMGCARGADLIERGIGGKADPRTALPMFQRAAEIFGPACPEDATACFVLGFLSEGGKGVPKNPAKAIEAYRQACNVGHGDSCMYLATALDNGLAGTKDPDGANAAFDKACTRYDNGEACQKIAERLGMAKQDLPRAFELATRGCRLDPKNCGTLGEFYRLGLGLAAADQALANTHYKVACEAGGGWCETYGTRAHDGVGMHANPAAAIAALERGCKGGYPGNCYLAAKYLIANKTDDARASTLATMGCDSKHGDACYLAGWLQGAGRAGGPASPERALALHERACTHGSPIGCNAAGDAYRAGTGTTADPAKAIARFQTGCEGTDELLSAGACKSWGLMAYFGEAGPKDAALALSSFTRACEYGEPDTCGYLPTLVAETGGTIEPVLAVMDKSCKAGHEHACIAYGNQLVTSPSEADRRKAYEAFTASCARKSEDGCLRQADLLADGWGITKDVAKAEQLYRARCDAGRAGACFGMARLYEKQAQPDEALKMYVRACEGGWGDACSAAGFAYYTARGVRWDVTNAATYFVRACELGSAVGCANSGDVYRYGVGAPIDHPKAFEHYEKACRPIDPTGCAGVGHYLATGEGGTRIDKARAEQALRAACLNQNYVMPEACRGLAELLETNRKGTPAEIARLRTNAFTRTQELAKDNPYYMYLLGTFYAQGMATVKDPAAALVWLGKACEGFDPLGCIAAGKALRATGTPADADRARVYFERACAAGVDDGCKLTAEKPAPRPTPVARPQGCGCGGEIAPGGGPGLAALALVVIALLRRKR